MSRRRSTAGLPRLRTRRRPDRKERGENRGQESSFRGRTIRRRLNHARNLSIGVGFSCFLAAAEEHIVDEVLAHTLRILSVAYQRQLAGLDRLRLEELV